MTSVHGTSYIECSVLSCWIAYGHYWQLAPNTYKFQQFYDLAPQGSELMTSVTYSE